METCIRLIELTMNLNTTYSRLKKKLFINFILLLGLFVFFPLASFGADSTKVSPPSVITPNQKVIVNVLHYYNGYLDASSSIMTNATCPNNGAMSWKRFYYENTGAVDSTLRNRGWFYYSCPENYFLNDQAYQNLKNNTWITCPDNVNYRCTIKHTSPPVISIIAMLPLGTSSVSGSNPYMRFNQLILSLGTTTSSLLWRGQIDYSAGISPTPSSSITFTINFDQPGVTPIFPLGPVYWRIYGPSISAPFPAQFLGGTVTRQGTYACPGRLQPPAVINVSNAMFGKTCTLSCLGPWDWYDRGNAECTSSSVECARTDRVTVNCQ